MAIVKLELNKNIEQSYTVKLTSLNDEAMVQGRLPDPIDLKSSFRTWRESACENISRLKPKKAASSSDLKQSARSVREELNQWLNSSDLQWQNVREELILLLRRSQDSGKEIRLLIDDDDFEICRYPLQEWSRIGSDFPRAEVAIRVHGKGLEKIRPITPDTDVKILMVEGANAVEGSENGLQTNLDVAIVQGLKQRGARVKYLPKPNRQELRDALMDEAGHHIFVFSGHSRSNQDGSIGYIGINDEDELPIDEFKRIFKVAIDQGLQLAVFNSCDGLGLAKQLAKLNLPRCIVMREPVPDDVAVDFLQQFFKQFSQDQSLFTAMNRARTALEALENRYPSVSWLPALCIRESALKKPFTWDQLIDAPLPLPPIQSRDRFSSTQKRTLLFIAGLVGASLLGWGVHRWIDKTDTVTRQNLSETCPKQATQTIPRGRNSNECLAYINVPDRKIYHGGSTTWAPIRGTVNPVIEEIHPDFDLTYIQPIMKAPGSTSGIEMLIDNQIDFAESSRDLFPEEIQIARSRGFDLKAKPAAVDAIAIVVHPELNVKSLTIDQINQIYTGEIKNWNQVGGSDLEITPYSRPDESGTTGFFKESVLGNEEFSDNVEIVSTTTIAIQRLSRDEGGIYFATASEVVGQCLIKPLPLQANAASPIVTPYQEPLVLPTECPAQRNQLNIDAFQDRSYPLTRRIFVIVKEDDSMDGKVGEAYVSLLLTNEGQKLIQEAGFIPIRSID